jgi:hypothetical protein
MNQVEFLLRLSENAQEQGNEIENRHRVEREAHARELTELWRLIELARQNIWAEMHRWGVAQDVLRHQEAQKQQHDRAALPAGQQQGSVRILPEKRAADAKS